MRFGGYYVLFTSGSWGENSLQPLSLLPSMSFVFFLIDTYWVLVIPYVLASSPVVHIEAQRPNRPRAFRVFFWVPAHTKILLSPLSPLLLDLNNFRFRSQHRRTCRTPLVDQQTKLLPAHGHGHMHKAVLLRKPFRA